MRAPLYFVRLCAHLPFRALLDFLAQHEEGDLGRDVLHVRIALERDYSAPAFTSPPPPYVTAPYLTLLVLIASLLAHWCRGTSRPAFQAAKGFRCSMPILKNSRTLLTCVSPERAHASVLGAS